MWSYYTYTTGNGSLASLDRGLNLMGEDGWELVQAFTTVKTIINVAGNSLVFIFKKPGVGQRPSSEALQELTGAVAY